MHKELESKKYQIFCMYFTFGMHTCVDEESENIKFFAYMHTYV